MRIIYGFTITKLLRMKTQPHHNLILSLIKDDLTNYRLITGLNALGLEAGRYYSNIGSAVFTLMGFGKAAHNDDLHDLYFQYLHKARKIDVSQNPKALDKLAHQIIHKLKQKIPSQQQNSRQPPQPIS